MSSDEQLLGFFAYSFFVYPVTNYLVSPKRAWKRWQGAVYAVLFLLLIAVGHVVFENSTKGPNHYERLETQRGSSESKIKQKYRQLSLKLHPDKNKAPSAAADFNKVTQAYNVLQDAEKRKIYERLGDLGVRASANIAIDHKYLVMQMLMYYGSTTVFAFFMLFSDSTGEALTLSMFGLVFCLLVETLLVLEEFVLPTWLFPYHTAYDVVSTLHRLFPAFMNGCRCLIGAFQVDRKADRVAILTSLNASVQRISLTAGSIVQDFMGVGQSSFTTSEGLVALALKSNKETSAENDGILATAAIIADPAKLKKHQRSLQGSSVLAALRNLAVFILLRLILKSSITLYDDRD